MSNVHLQIILAIRNGCKTTKDIMDQTNLPLPEIHKLLLELEKLGKVKLVSFSARLPNKNK